MYKYLKLISAGTSYSTKMQRLSNRIFGEVTRPTNKTSMRVVERFAREPYHVRDEIINYYPRHVETFGLMRALRYYGLYRDEHLDFKDEMKRLRALRGKVKVQKAGSKKNKDKKETKVAAASASG